MTLNVLEDGAQYDTMTVSGSADGTLTGTTSYTGTGTLTFSVADETLSAVKVQYVDGSGNALTLDSSATNTEELSTDEATAISLPSATGPTTTGRWQLHHLRCGGDQQPH